jgi:hypothetical protein
MKNWATIRRFPAYGFAGFAVVGALGGDADGADGACALSGAVSALTCVPGRAFWSPSTTTRSPGLSPADTM